MLLHLFDQSLDLFNGCNICCDPNGFPFQSPASREVVETCDSLIDTLLAASFAGCDEDGFGAGEKEGCGRMQTKTARTCRCIDISINQRALGLVGLPTASNKGYFSVQGEEAVDVDL